MIETEGDLKGSNPLLAAHKVRLLVPHRHQGLHRMSKGEKGLQRNLINSSRDQLTDLHHHAEHQANCVIGAGYA